MVRCAAHTVRTHHPEEPVTTDSHPHHERVALIAQHLRDHRGHTGPVEQKDLDAAADLAAALDALAPEGTPGYRTGYVHGRADVVREIAKAQRQWDIDHGATP